MKFSPQKSTVQIADLFRAQAVYGSHGTKRTWQFGEFVEQVYFPFYERRWKRSTAENNVNRMTNHLVADLGESELSAFRRDELQDLLDRKAASALSFSVVDHLRWDLKQVFDLAMAEGLLERNPALLLFTPKEAVLPTRRVMNLEEVQKGFSVFEQRERLIVKFGILAGMRPGLGVTCFAQSG